MVYYRSDILAQEKLEPPKTWDDYLNIAKTLNGKDLNGDGDAGLRLVHCQSQSPAVLLVDHFDRRAVHPEPGHCAGCLLQYGGYAAAVQ